MYTMCMSRLSVYVPDDLAERARKAGLNISARTQAATREELDSDAARTWLPNLPAGRGQVTHDAALAALDEARAEFEDDQLGGGQPRDGQPGDDQ